MSPCLCIASRACILRPGSLQQQQQLFLLRPALWPLLCLPCRTQCRQPSMLRFQSCGSPAAACCCALCHGRRCCYAVPYSHDCSVIGVDRVVSRVEAASSRELAEGFEAEPPLLPPRKKGVCRHLPFQRATGHAHTRHGKASSSAIMWCRSSAGSILQMDGRLQPDTVLARVFRLEAVPPTGSLTKSRRGASIVIPTR